MHFGTAVRCSRSVRAHAAGEQTAGRSVRLRVERQTHLPANRCEAWKALESLTEPGSWHESSLVFAAVESIYRVECQQMGEQLQRAYRAANDAVEEIPPFEDMSKRNHKAKGGWSEAHEASVSEQHAVEAFRNDSGAAGKSLAASKQGQEKDQRSVNGASSASPADAGPEQGSTSEFKTSLNAGASRAGRAAKRIATKLQHEVEDLQVEQDDATSGEAASEDAESATDRRESVSESEVLTLASVDFESASRLEYDRSRRSKVNLDDVVDGQKADQDFMRALVSMLRKAHFVHLSFRDEALARSLNADYVAQLFISPDTRRLDVDLVKPTIQSLDVPEQAQAMLVFKRGYGQARRKGQMLIAKLDYLQYIVVRGFVSSIGARTKALWRSVHSANQAKQEAKDSSTADGLGNTVQSAGLQSFDDNLWTVIQQQAQRTGKQLSEWGILSPRFLLAGGGLFMTLSNWGLLPQVDVEPLGSFTEAWKPNEPDRLAPVHVERVSLRDALAARRGLSLQNMLGTIELVEPTFQELLVLYRHAPEPGWLAPLRRKLFGPTQEEQLLRYRRRNPIFMRVFRDVPLPTWKIVFPDKLLQFRPLDGLRADLLTVAGLAAFVAQAKYDSVILELITLSSAVVLLVRVVLGYKRMYDRFEQMANEMLAETTIAGQEGVIEYVANSAALQQFEQTSLAYLMLRQAQEPLNAKGLCIAVESLLEETFQVKVRFDAAEALSELQRLGLAEDGSQGYTACQPQEAFKKLKDHWDGLLLPGDLDSEPLKQAVHRES